MTKAKAKSEFYKDTTIPNALLDELRNGAAVLDTGDFDPGWLGALPKNALPPPARPRAAWRLISPFALGGV